MARVLWSLQAVKVMALFVSAQRDATFTGWAVCRETKLSVGVAYPILKRFEQFGFLTSTGDVVDHRLAPRVRRLYYALTPAGRRAWNDLRELTQSAA